MKFILHKHLLIKNFTAAFLLCVFTLGITPKKTLHSLLANHTDNTAKSGDGKTQQLNKAGFNCRCDDQVAESNFIADTFFIVNNPIVHSSFVVYNKSSFYSLSRFLFNLRGPPENFQS